jgi:hypothetical protein
VGHGLTVTSSLRVDSLRPLVLRLTYIITWTYSDTADLRDGTLRSQIVKAFRDATVTFMVQSLETQAIYLLGRPCRALSQDTRNTSVCPGRRVWVLFEPPAEDHM